MAQLFQLVLVIMTLIEFQGYVTAQGPECSKISKCLQAREYRDAVRNKHTVGICSIFKRALDCMNPHVEGCLRSLPEKRMGSMFTRQRDRLQKKHDETCNKEGNVTAEDQKCLEELRKCGKSEEVREAMINNPTRENCNLSQTTIDCMNPHVEGCLRWHPLKSMWDMFTKQLDRLHQTRDEKCNKEGNINAEQQECLEGLSTCVNFEKFRKALINNPTNEICRKLQGDIDWCMLLDKEICLGLRSPTNLVAKFARPLDRVQESLNEKCYKKVTEPECLEQISKCVKPEEFREAMINKPSYAICRKFQQNINLCMEIGDDMCLIFYPEKIRMAKFSKEKAKFQQMLNEKCYNKGNVIVQDNRACSELRNCVESKFKEAVINKHTAGTCSISQKAIDCMNPHIEGCLRSLNPKNVGVTFVGYRDKLQQSVDKKCNNKGVVTAQNKDYSSFVKYHNSSIGGNVFAEDQECLDEINKCVKLEEFREAIINKPTDEICRKFQENINYCMYLQMQMCARLPSLRYMVDTFARQQSRLQQMLKEKCYHKRNVTAEDQECLDEISKCVNSEEFREAMINKPTNAICRKFQQDIKLCIEIGVLVCIRLFPHKSRRDIFIRQRNRFRQTLNEECDNKGFVTAQKKDYSSFLKYNNISIGGNVTEEECLDELNKCYKPKEFMEVLRNKHYDKMCSMSQKAIDCLNRHIEGCLRTLTRKRVGAKFLDDRHRLQQTMDATCNNKASTTAPATG